MHNSQSGVCTPSVHLVFVVKYRRRVLTREILERCEEIIADTADVLGITVLEVNGESDHVHFLSVTRPGSALPLLLTG